jgi:hypothetical protein
MEPLPSPRTPFAGAVWLARILEKARRMNAGTLPAEYASRFGATNGTDGQFLGFFQLGPDQVLAIAGKPDEEAAAWFLSQPGITAARIIEWNHLAENLGREGFPMAERLPVALATTYAHLQGRDLQTLFEVLEADEEIC